MSSVYSSFFFSFLVVVVVVIALVKVIGFYPLGCYLVSLMFKFTVLKTCPVGFSCTFLTLSVLRE